LCCFHNKFFFFISILSVEEEGYPFFLNK